MQPTAIVPENIQRLEPGLLDSSGQENGLERTNTVAADSLPLPASTVAPTPTLTATPVVTSVVAPGSASQATQEATPAAAPASEPAATVIPVAARVQLSGITHQWQTWNNCGPATVTMNMSYFGHAEMQADAASFLKPNRDDKNVSPHELAAYTRSSTGLQALVRRGGSLEQMKLLLSNNLPVLAGTWLVHDGDGLGHYRLLVGYDDATGQFDTYDSLNGPNYKVTYEQFEADWRVFNRLYVLIFPPEQEPTVRAILGEAVDDIAMYESILAAAQAELAANPDDAIAYFNQGDALTYLKRYEEATASFDKARQLGLHWRRLWYQFTPFEAYYAVGRYQDVLDLTGATLKSAGGLEEAYYYHGLALHATGQPGAEEDFQAALDYNPNFTPAAEALNQLTAR
jgi:tetratricopeptide (TPR) repeat protein